MMDVFKKVFGSKNDREIRRLLPRVAAINALEPAIKALSDDQLRGKTAELRTKLENGATLDHLLHEAFAVVREAGWRAVKMRHFDVQLIGGMVLHSGKIAEMRTGEGKTLVATLPAYLNALEGQGVHVVTVNDYLANRDAEWMGKIYRFLGMKVGVIVHGYEDDHKQRQYGCDITYGTNSEFGFDYLRDNMKYSLSEYVQRGNHYAIIDEVDSVLVDEARTPLIISGPAEESTDRYITANNIVSKLRLERDYTVDEKSKSAVLTDEGTDHVERMLKVGNLYEPENLEWLHHVTKALQAHACYKRDVEYLIQEGEVLIIDEHTGRTMPGRRWSDGLHQAIEAKEGVKIQRENITLATITYQNLYRMYKKLSGMTGTADTEAEEFHKIYKLDVVVIPTNKSMIRKDNEDLVYKTEAEKFGAVIDDIKERHGRGQPVLVGTRSVDKSEVVARLLGKHGIPHTVLNAKFHRQEGEIIAQAGSLGMVTISTNMAGRGTDILLGGNPEYLSRAAVAHEELGDATADPEREQRVLAEFRWLSGSPDSIPLETLTADYADRRWSEKVRAGLLRPQPDGVVKVFTSEALAEATAAAPPEGEARTVGEVRAQCAQEAREYLERIIGRYAHHLEHFDQECQVAKKKVIEAGGLHVLGTERHESRRVDNQLRGRAGRQGDPGSSQFYLSLEDDLMRLFGGDKLVVMMDRLGMEDGVPIEARMVTKSIEGAQRRVEGHHFDIRKNLIEYDDVLNQQRKAIYGLRRQVLGEDEMKEEVLDMIERVLLFNVDQTCSRKVTPDEWRLEELKNAAYGVFGAEMAWLTDSEDVLTMRRDELEEKLYGDVEARWAKKIADLEARFAVVDDRLLPKERLPSLAKIREPVWRYLLRQIYLREIDLHWREHLTQMDHLKEGIHLRGYGQRDPKLEYKREGFLLYESMMREIDHNTTEKLFHVEVVSSEAVEREAERQRRAADSLARAAQLAGGGSEAQAQADAAPPPSAEAPSGNGPRPAAASSGAKRPGRNDPCWCGSGKKYKKCHLPEDESRARA
ncbi:MAG: preprotein translocase subunit SecA [Deltaproteobacteria bacterium]|nr:preprotein translocase subunit SecA [Deltaproteobacteria bacterium]